MDREEKVDSFFQGNILVNQFKVLPAEIAKYSQSFSAIQNLSNKDSNIKTNSSKYKKESETVLEYAQRHQASATVPAKDKNVEISLKLHDKEEKIILKGTKETATNSTIDQRRKKHKAIAENMATKLSDTEIKEIIMESSGINLILQNHDRLASLLSISPQSHSNISASQMIEEYILDEKHKQLDKRVMQISKGRHSLIDIAKQVCFEKQQNKDRLQTTSVILPTLKSTQLQSNVEKISSTPTKYIVQNSKGRSILD